jgi:hypothetical protein
MHRNNPNYRRNNTSRPRGASNRRNNNARTPFCKVCLDAGKPKSEYTSHYVKDRPGPHGKVCCPYLLSLVCRYCHKTGHTPNHCSEVKAKESRAAAPKPEPREKSSSVGWSTVPGKGNSRRRVQRTKEVVPVKASTNKFDALSFEPTQADKDERKDFPKLGAAKRSSSYSDDEATVVPHLTGWSKVATSAPLKDEVKPAIIPVIRYTARVSLLKDGGKAWADMSDSESDDEELDECKDYATSYGQTSQVAMVQQQVCHFDNRRETVDNSAWSSCDESDIE